LGFIPVPLITAAEVLALEAANPPMLAVAATRPRTTPGNGVAGLVPSGNLASCSRGFPVLFIINPSFAGVAALFNPG
jgi:hypothetical protein